MKSLTKAEKDEQKRLRAAAKEEKRQQKIKQIDANLKMHRQRNLEYFRRNSDIIEGVQILTSQNCCDNCRKHHERVFELNDVPDLPIEECTSEYGYCRCSYIAVIEGLPPK
jgi:hypothetical protein